MSNDRKNLFGTVFATWWPLAASWLMMGFELPAVSAVMARLPDPEINLAAYGGVVFPIALLIEGPIIMILAASTALSRDRISYCRLRRFMLLTVALLTAAHLLLAATPLYHFVVGHLMGIPSEIQGPARIGLLLLTPWTASIGYRRFQQGVLIRFGRSRMVGVGTAVRLVANVTVLFIGYRFTSLSGIVVGTLAVSAGVVSEAVFAGIAVRPVLRGRLAPSPATGAELTSRGLLAFYIPLAITPVIILFAQPVVSSAMSRMARPIDSLAVWPVLMGLIFTLRSLGFAFNEVVVVHAENRALAAELRRFALLLGGSLTLILLLIAATPLARFWFGGVSALSADLVPLGAGVIWVALLMPAASVAQSYYQGRLVHLRRTRAITESVILYLLATFAVLGAGILSGRVTGIYVGQGAMLVGNMAQVVWLRFRSNRILRLEEAGGGKALHGEEDVAPASAGG